MSHEIRLRQSGEIRGDSGATRLRLDAYTAQRLGARDPLAKDAPAGDTLIHWLFPLHTGEAFGTPGRAFITVFGLTPLIFAITGVLIWWKRRSGHRRHLAEERERVQRAGGAGRRQFMETLRSGVTMPARSRSASRAAASRLSQSSGGLPFASIFANTRYASVLLS